MNIEGCKTFLFYIWRKLNLSIYIYTNTYIYTFYNKKFPFSFIMAFRWNNFSRTTA